MEPLQEKEKNESLPGHWYGIFLKMRRMEYKNNSRESVIFKCFKPFPKL